MSSLAAPDADIAAHDRRRALAIAAILTAITVWGMQFVMIRLAVTTSLTPFDITALRYVFAMPAMIPILWMYGWRNGAGLGWRRALVLTVLGGAPMLMLSNFGLLFAPANHASCLQPGTVAVVSTLFLMATAGARRSLLTPLGLVAAVLGLGLVALSRSGVTGVGPLTPLGDLLFVMSGVCWAWYTILLVRWKASPLVMTALCAVMSLAIMPLFLAFMPSRIATAPWSDIILHGVFQGLVNYTFAFLLWAFAAKVLGPVRIGYSAPLIPVFGVLCAIPVLGEWPAPLQWAGVAGVVGGLLAIAWSQRSSAFARA
jgi:drug/metabolite transporter (DMT)-like permease